MADTSHPRAFLHILIGEPTAHEALVARYQASLAFCQATGPRVRL